MRTAINVERPLLEVSIQIAEKERTWNGLSTLSQRISEIYNAEATKQGLSTISSAVVGLRIKEWGIPLKTGKGKKGKAERVIKRDILEPILTLLRKKEKRKTFVFAQAAEKYTEETGENICPMTLMKRAEEWGLWTKKERSKKEPKIEEKIVDAPKSKSHYCGCKFINITAPAGPCPAKLSGVSKEELEAWSQKVMETGHKAELHYSLEALQYFVRQFYDMDTTEFKTAHGILANLEQSWGWEEDEKEEEEMEDSPKIKLPEIDVSDVEEDVL